MTQKIKKSRMKSSKYVQLLIRRLCSELFYYDMSNTEYVSHFLKVRSWIHCENVLGRIDDEYVNNALEYARTVSKCIVYGEKGYDHNAD